MNMFWHDHVANHHELLAPPHLFQNFEKQVTPASRAQQRVAAVTAEGDEMQIPGSVIARQAPRHGDTLEDGRADFCEEFTEAG